MKDSLPPFKHSLNFVILISKRKQTELMPNLDNLTALHKQADTFKATLVAVSKTHPTDTIQEVYNAGQRIFGENKAREAEKKHKSLPKDIEWHFIGHLQRNKVKYIAPFVSLIHSVDSLKLLQEINNRAAKENRVINCLLQVHIAEESNKFGLDSEELNTLLSPDIITGFKHINIKGLMGMATFTDDKEQVRREFSGLKTLFDKLAEKYKGELSNVSLKELSMGMSGDYEIALECGSTMIRVGSAIFGARNYNT